MNTARIPPFIWFLLRRLCFLIATYFIALTIVFILPRAIPGNPLASLLTQLFQQAQTNPETIKEVYKKLMEEFGIGKPWWEQYVEFISRAFRGDLGTSINFYPRKVVELIASALPWTLALLIPATLVAWVVGNALGALAGYKRGTLFEKTVVIISLILSQTPYYWLAMVLLFIFSVKLNIFPYAGAFSQGIIPSLSLEFVLDVLWHYALPFLSIVLVNVGSWIVSMRLLIISELESDYVHFAEIIGTKNSKILKYATRNALLPQVTGLALALGSTLSGALITEVVFTYPGMGYILFKALSTLDYPLIQGIFVLLIATLYIANFVVDFIYVLIDPRIRLVGETV
ncbi:MAG: ABC transporter permease [Ignisphaera sp.]